MTSRFTRGLTLGKKLLLACVAIAATVTLITAGLLSPPRGSAQAQAASIGLPKFEVASVKPSRTNGPYSSDTLPGGRFTAANYSLDMLIRTAFGVEDYQLVGVPGSLGAERYDIDAKTVGPHPQRIGREEEEQLLQALLLDRFSLKFHRETKEISLYSLVVAKNGPRLVEHTGPGRSSLNANSGSIIGRKTMIANLAWGIRLLLHRPVTDNTGVNGEFDFNLEWTPEETVLSSISGLGVGADLFSALQEQLGLKLESRKGSVEVIVVDHIERPTAN